MNKNTLIVTGGAGFVGSNLIILLLKKTNFKMSTKSKKLKKKKIKLTKLTKST